MIVRDLIEKLSKMNPDFEVYICVDGIHGLDHVDAGALDKEEMEQAPPGTPDNAVALGTDD